MKLGRRLPLVALEPLPGFEHAPDGVGRARVTVGIGPAA